MQVNNFLTSRKKGRGWKKTEKKESISHRPDGCLKSKDIVNVHWLLLVGL